MINDTGSRKLAVSHIKISDNITPQIKRLLMAYPAMLRDAGSLTLEAIQMAAMQAPPIVYEKKDSSGTKKYYCIGNLRTVLLAKSTGKNISIRSTIVESPQKNHVDSMAMSLFLSEESCFIVNPDLRTRFLLNFYQLWSDRNISIAMTDISPDFRSKKAFLEAFGINRRSKQ